MLLNLFQVNVSSNDHLISTIEEQDVHNTQELQEYFAQEISHGLEGVVVKRKEGLYQAGKRNFNWIKLKRTQKGVLLDTLDCVVLGYYYGSGKRSQFGIGAILVGVYNEAEDCYQTIAKVGAGFSDQEWIGIKQICDSLKLEKKPVEVECAKELYPNVWVTPTIVCVIQADEITLSPLHTAREKKEPLGFALRFPRFIEYRSDKSAAEATTAKEVLSLYKQGRHFQRKNFQPAI